MYSKYSEYRNITYWVCCNKFWSKCDGKVSTYGKEIIKINGTHNHLPKNIQTENKTIVQTESVRSN